MDLTFGGGGHSCEILSRMDNDAQLMAFDQDRDAIANLPQDERLIFVNHNFRYLANFMRYYGWDGVDGILADLGVSSHEFDEAERGFSFRFDAPLDMRMNQSATLTAANVLNEYDVDALKRIFADYGELDGAYKVANMIVRYREEHELVTSADLYKAVERAIPREREKKFLAKLYQALRIEVNGELDVLEEMLASAMKVLKPGGRLSVITYHSLEDRLVKNFFKSGNAEGKVEKDPITGRVNFNFREVNRKVIVPTDQEILENPRSRSAKLRILEKIGD
jgi:16S rRNA (cytosine1402-N4)-methyltransferase